MTFKVNNSKRILDKGFWNNFLWIQSNFMNSRYWFLRIRIWDGNESVYDLNKLGRETNKDIVSFWNVFPEITPASFIPEWRCKVETYKLFLSKRTMLYMAPAFVIGEIKNKVKLSRHRSIFTETRARAYSGRRYLNLKIQFTEEFPALNYIKCKQ